MNLQHPVLRHIYLIGRKDTITASEYDSAVAAAKTFVGQAFGALSTQLKQITEVARVDNIPPVSFLSDSNTLFREKLVGIMHMVDGMIVGFEAAHSDMRRRYSLSESSTPSKSVRFPPRVFVVHGHDHSALAAVSEFLRGLGLEVCVLKDEPNKGRTVIEKFEQEADGADYAVVICTPDDQGYACAQGVSAARSRARQNVILELGYFIANLQRSRVCALMVGDIEMPSDVTGVLYTRFDAGNAWRTELLRELQAAGVMYGLPANATAE